MEKVMKKESKELRKKCKQTVDGLLFMVYIALFILIIIWLFKLIKNTKSEPKYRQRYIGKEPSVYYDVGEFCYDSYEKFVSKGAFDLFDLRMKRIKKYAKALVSTMLIAIGSLIFATIFAHLAPKHACLFCLAALFYLFLLISIILSLAFAIVLAHHYFKAEFDDFIEFSKCRYLTKQFRKDYNFIFKIKDEFKMPFVLVIITEFLSFVNLVAGVKTDKDESYKIGSRLGFP